MKIFEFSGNKGSYIDPISGAVGVNTNGEFAKTEKGLAWRGDGATSKVLFEKAFDLNQDWSISITAKIGDLSNSSWDGLITIGDGSAFYTEGLAVTLSRVIYWDGAGQAGNYTASLPLAEYYLFQLIHDLSAKTIYFYLNGIANGSATYTGTLLSTPTYITIGDQGQGTQPGNFKGDEAKVTFYDHVLTAKERASLMVDFLRAGSVTRKVTNNLSYPKPLVNHDPGCVAHYNMIPSPGGILTDITGNGNDGDIVGAVSSKDGIVSTGNEKDSIIAFSSVIADDLSVWGLQFVFDKYKSGILDFIFGGGSDKNVFLNNGGFGFREEDNTFQIWNGGGSTIALSTATLEVGLNIITLTSNGTIVKLYYNGIDYGHVTPTLTILFVSQLLQGYSSNLYTPELELQDFKLFDYYILEQQAIDYHNQFARRIHTRDPLAIDAGVGQDGSALSGTSFQVISGTFSVQELSAQDPNVPQLDKFMKYMRCDTNGSFKVFYPDSTDVDAIIDYYNGSVWSRKEDTLANLITDNAWLSLSGGSLVFTLTANDAIATDLIRKGVFQ